MAFICDKMFQEIKKRRKNFMMTTTKMNVNVRFENDLDFLTLMWSFLIVEASVMNEK